ncbi:hypothetical protein [Sulfuricurvum sp.]|uniref:hypothetical protein n=1 Tax=Sulfuricurvum sp. TaxID=2025608 RepID=UPI0035697E50
MGLIFDELTVTGTDQKFTLGTTRKVGDKSYIYCQIAAASGACANGSVLYYTSTEGVFTTSGTAAVRNLVKGVGNHAIAAGSFGWVQTWGDHTAVKTNGDDDIAAGDSLIGLSSTGTCDSVAGGTAPTYNAFGIATAADVDSQDTVAAYLIIQSASN